MNEELKKIKKLYGEKMMQLCISLFPTILEDPGKLLNILESKFHPSKYLCEDIISNDLVDDFKNYIYFLFNGKTEEKQEENITPYELLDKAGYTLYECHSEEDIQSFRHYYYRKGSSPVYTGGTSIPYSGEELCTFNGGRLNSCYVFFAVKKNVDEIKRENFNKPARQDEYGVSVLSIQFSRGKVNTLSIKNRYNHTVPNPDATFSNNLDNIISGLTNSFRKYYGLNINENESLDFEIPGYVLAKDGCYYKYNYEIGNTYYCPDNIIIDDFDVINKYHNEKERYIILDYFILDLKEKKVKLYDNDIDDPFPVFLTNIKDIQIKNNKESNEKNIVIIKETGGYIYITLDKYFRIVKYRNDSIKRIYDYFLYLNKVLTSIDLPSVESIGSNFLHCNEELTSINLQNVEYIGDSFLHENVALSKIELPKVKSIGTNFLYYNRKLSEINILNIKNIRSSFLYSNEELTSINLPIVENIGVDFLSHNKKITSINMPNVIHIENRFLLNNLKLTSISLPKTKYIGSYFLSNNTVLTSINIPEVKVIKSNFLSDNKILSKIELSKLECIGTNFLHCNEELTSISLPNVTQIGSEFLLCNEELTSINLPNVKSIGENFLISNKGLTSINFPNAIEIGAYFLENNKKIANVFLPNVKYIGYNFLYCNEELTSINLPNVLVIGSWFLYHNKKVESIELPQVEYINACFLSNNKELTSIELPRVKEIRENFLGCKEKLINIVVPRDVNMQDIKKYSNIIKYIDESIDISCKIKIRGNKL